MCGDNAENIYQDWAKLLPSHSGVGLNPLELPAAKCSLAPPRITPDVGKRSRNPSMHALKIVAVSAKDMNVLGQRFFSRREMSGSANHCTLAGTTRSFARFT